MQKLLRALAGLVIGFFAGAFVSSGLIAALSTNAHDKSLEVAMTAMFVGGPIGAVVGLVAGLMWQKKS